MLRAVVICIFIFFASVIHVNAGGFFNPAVNEQNAFESGYSLEPDAVHTPRHGIIRNSIPPRRNNRATSPSRTAFLTFDDGPTGFLTPRVLDILAEHGVPATFFVLPHTGVDHLYRRILNEGHLIANHSYSHNFSLLYNYYNPERFHADLVQMNTFLYDLLGIRTNIYRFPGGSRGRNEQMINDRVEILRSLGYIYFDWNVSAADTDRGPAGQNPTGLMNNVLSGAANTNRPVILMHDTWNEALVEALPGIITGLKEMGFRFDTLDNF